MKRSKMYGIITGDIVKSRKIAPKDREKLYADCNLFLQQRKKNWLSSFEVYRGDSIQCKVQKPQYSLRVALIVRCFLKSYLTEKEKTARAKKKVLKGYFNARFDIRLAIGIGAADFIHANKISVSDGEAFQLSGEALDGLKEDDRKLSLKTYDAAFNEQMEPVMYLLDALIDKWTQNQAEIVLYKLENIKDEKIAEKLNISTSAVTQRKKTAQWNAIEKAVIYFEKTMQSLIK
jgi:hypothetical protein